MKTNRLMTRRQASMLDLSSRIKLEAHIMDATTDAKRRDQTRIPADWTFDDHCNTPWRRHLFDYLGPLEGRTILDLGCGVQPTPIYFALAGAKEVHACDVSPKAIDYVRELARRHGVSDRVKATVCPAEHMPFDDEQFDLVHGEAVLHHLRLSLAGSEVARVLKKGGRGGFKDPLGQNPLFEFVRDYVPYYGKHTAKGTDTPLRFSALETFGESFGQYSYRGFGMLSTLVAFFSRRRRQFGAMQVAHRMDGMILGAIPPLHRFCRLVIMCVEK